MFEQLKGGETGGEDDGNFGYATVPVPAECYSILLSRLQGEEPNSGFAETREQLNQTVRASPGSAPLLSALAIVDALLGRKQDTIEEARRAARRLPISEDVMDGPGVLANLAVVYSWTDEPNLAFEQRQHRLTDASRFQQSNIRDIFRRTRVTRPAICFTSAERLWV